MTPLDRIPLTVLNISSNITGLIPVIIFPPIRCLTPKNIDFEDVESELSEFVDFYKRTTIWWLSSLSVAVLSLIFDTQNNVILGIVLASLFIIPAASVFYLNYPFSISCNYRSFDEQTGQTNLTEEKENIAQITPDGVYEVELVIESGANVEQYNLEFNTPTGTEQATYQTQGQDIEVTKDENIIGHSSPIRNSNVLTLYFSPTSGVPPTGSYLIVRDSETGRTLEKVQFLPNNER